MKKMLSLLLCVVVLGVVGCDNKADNKGNKKPGTKPGTQAAAKTKVCPVTGKEIKEGNGMTPLMVKYEGKDVALCCKGCKAKFDKDPKKYMDAMKK